MLDRSNPGLGQSGLVQADNYQFIKDLLPGRTIFLGETIFEPNIRLGQERLAIGGSGCELTAEYRNMLAPGMLNEKSDDFAAGYADMIFVQSVAKMLNPDIIKSYPEFGEYIPEPEFFALLRRAH